MDLVAFTQIGSLEEVAKANGIEVPRLRGYRLMSEEEPFSDGELAEMLRTAEMMAADDWCTSIPAFSMNPFVHEYSWETDMKRERFLFRITENWSAGPHRETVGIRWDRIHGKRRKVLKYKIKKAQKAIKDNIAVWNKYAGKENILYIHARIGGENWSYYGGEELEKQPWFIEKVDDLWDSTYCDIYARVDLSKVKKGECE